MTVALPEPDPARAAAMKAAEDFQTAALADEHLIGAAMRLAGIVQMFDPVEADELLDDELTDEQRRGLYLVLAAMLPIDRTPEELLAWRDARLSPRLRVLTGYAPAAKLLPGDEPDKARLSDCGTRRGYLNHIKADERACDDCQIANEAWERTRIGDNRRAWAERRDAGQDQLPIDQEDASHAAA